MTGPDNEDYLLIDGRRLAYRRLGTGPPLLLVNGYAATGADWDPALLAGLTDSFEVISPDNRGMGASDPGDLAELTVDAMAHDLLALLDHLGIARVALVGWSMGGFIAQRITALAPARVTALALLATDPGGPTAVRADPRDWAALTDASGTPREQASRLIALLFPADLAPAIDEQFGEMMAEARAQISPATLRTQERAIALWHETVPDPVGPDAPRVLVACGTEDIVIPSANAETLADHWAGCRVERYAGGGHAFMAQVPTELAGLLTAFLRGGEAG